MTLHRRPLQRASVIERAALGDRLLDELLDQARENAPLSRRPRSPRPR